MLLFLDTETGGTDEQLHDLLTLGMVLVDEKDFSRHGEFYGHLKLDTYRVTPTAMRINKINLAEISEEGRGYSKDEMINAIYKFLSKHIKKAPITVVGHNVDFDLRFLRKLFKDCDRDDEFYDVFSYRKIDTSTLLQTVSVLNPKYNIASLSNAIKFFNVEFDEDKRHNALEDAKGTIQVYENLLKMIDVTDIKTSKTKTIEIDDDWDDLLYPSNYY